MLQVISYGLSNKIIAYESFTDSSYLICQQKVDRISNCLISDNFFENIGTAFPLVDAIFTDIV